MSGYKVNVFYLCRALSSKVTPKILLVRIKYSLTHFNINNSLQNSYTFVSLIYHAKLD